LTNARVIARKLSRRLVLQIGAAAAGGLLIGTVLPRLRDRTAHPMLTPWLRIAPDASVTMMIPSAEMGQGITTSLPMLIAEELEIDWREVQFEFAPVNPAYANPIFHVQATGGSTSIRAFYSPLRQVGAVARALLCQAAAAKWGVPISECSAANGRISHSSGQSENYGALADAAAKLPLPANVELKARSNWRILGKSTARLDTLPKVDGSAQFGIDVLVPEMLVGTIAACPVFGGKLEAVDDKPALAVKGVKAVVKLPDAVAVVGDGYWPCKKGLEALSPQWDEGPNATLDSERIATALNDGFGDEGAVAEAYGDPAAALQKAAKTVEAIYT
jgi:isoquinoline 1-oxidoreductase beta subunit